MTEEKKKIHEPLFHISKRDALPWWKSALVRFGAILIALVVCGVLSVVLIGANPFRIYGVLIQGAFLDPWTLMQNTALLLGFGIAIVPAFRMKFWNMGANGQVMIACLAAIACMFHLTGKLPNAVIILLMAVTSIGAGIVWAVIPAVFKAFFNTNETLFTLMMNYIAAGLISYFVYVWDKSHSGNLGIVNLFTHDAWLPDIGNKYVLSILVIFVLTALMYVYMRFSKHGYEISVVGESPNTARYVGIDVKKVVIRTLALSGAICGIVGFLLAGSVEHTVNSTIAGDRGFTAILVAWLSNFNPIVMILVSFFVIFLNTGAQQVSAIFQLKSNDFSSIIIGIIFFFIIGSEFFVNYRLKCGPALKNFGKKIRRFFLKDKPEEDKSEVQAGKTADGEGVGNAEKTAVGKTEAEGVPQEKAEEDEE